MKDASSIRLVLMDIDGTIVDSPHHRTVTLELAQAVRAVAEKGIPSACSRARIMGISCPRCVPSALPGLLSATAGHMW